MDLNNNLINGLSSALKNDGIQGHDDLDDLYRMDKEMDDIKLKLSQCNIECERTETLVYDVNQLKDKGTFVLKNVERRYSTLDEELKEIHCNYVKCITKVTSNDEIVHRKVNSLILQRDNLKKQFEELKKLADENGKKLIDIKNMIVIQEKKNTALTKKLNKMVRNVHMTPNLRDRINTILNDPRITSEKRTMRLTD